MKKLPKLLSLALALSMVAGLSACGGGGDTDADNTGSADPGTSASTPAEETGTKTFVFGSDANSTSFDPAADLQTNSAYALVASVMEPLWTVDDQGNTTCLLAESFEWTGDLELTVKLKEGITYSNGNALTSDDVLYTLEHFRDSGRSASMVACVDFENTTCPDDTTIVIAMNTYDAAFMDTMGNYSFGILDRETCEGFEAAGSWSWLIGTGPYKLKGDGVDDKSGWEESVQYTLVRNENYWGEAPYYDEIIIKFYSEESTRYSEFQAGNLDAVYVTEATYVNSLGSGSVSGANLVQKEAQSVYGFQISSGADSCGAFADINIRKAFAHGIDIATMVEVLGEGVYKVATSVLGEDNWAYLNVGTYEYDPEYAAECLAEAGYSVDNPLTLTIVAESTAFNTALAEQAQASLAEIGINLDLSGMGDFATILPTLLSGQQALGIGGPSNGSGNDPASLLQQFGPLSDNVLLRVTDERLVDLFNQGSASRDQEERVEIYHEFQQIMHDEYLYIPMWVETKNYGVLDEHASFESALENNNMLNPTKLTD